MPIVNLSAWEDGRTRKIVANAQKTFNATVADAQQIINWVMDSSIGPDANEFACSLFESYNTYGKLTEGQCAAVRKCIAREAEWAAQRADKQSEWNRKNEAEKAAAEEVPEGRVQITGEIVSTKHYEGDWGTQLKCVIKDDRGFKVFGSIPASVEDYAYSEDIELKGARITLVATVTQADDDTKFGFFKRPAKAELI